ncbi:MAG: hypothetical protein ABIU95_13505 [Burkholderiales bacterium]
MHAHTTIARAKLSDGRCEDALGAVLDALWVDPLSDAARYTLEQIATRCRVDFTLRSSLER